MNQDSKNSTYISPPAQTHRGFRDSAQATQALIELYNASVIFLCEHFKQALKDNRPKGRYRAFYPQISITTTRFAQIDSRLSFGYVAGPNTYATTITQPVLFRNYLIQQIGLLIENHDIEVHIGYSDTPIPLHFAIAEADIAIPADAGLNFTLRNVFDVPDLSTIDDTIVNADAPDTLNDAKPLAPFTAQRVDYSLARLYHYTATSAEHFQNYVLFTNYQFYVDEFESYARKMLAKGAGGYTSFVASGNVEITQADAPIKRPDKMPQMPTYHLKRAGGSGITLVNIGIGPSNAKTATDHIAVLRPEAWLMVGHCAGLRHSQKIGDYVLAHAYLREDHVLDDDLPVWIPIPPLAEVQTSLEQAVAEVTKLRDFEAKRIMRTGTVATIDNRNWELRDQSGPVKRLSQARAIALDMESATIAANGYRFRVPYGTLLCVSDKPLHGELKLPGMANAFYKQQVSQHLAIGIRAMEKLREMPLERVHSRKLRSFEETAFL